MSHVNKCLGFPQLSSRFKALSERLIAVSIGHFKRSCQCRRYGQMAWHSWVERLNLFRLPKIFVSFFIIKVWLGQRGAPKLRSGGYCLEGGGGLGILKLADALKVDLHRLEPSVANVWLPFQNRVWAPPRELAQVGYFQVVLLLGLRGALVDEGLLTVHLADARGRMPFNVIVDLRLAFIVAFIQVLDAWHPV